MHCHTDAGEACAYDDHIKAAVTVTAHVLDPRYWNMRKDKADTCRLLAINYPHEVDAARFAGWHRYFDESFRHIIEF